MHQLSSTINFVFSLKGVFACWINLVVMSPDGVLVKTHTPGVPFTNMD